MTLKELVNCPDCNLSMTVHTLKYIHKKEDTYCKGAIQEEEAEEVRKCETIREKPVPAKPTKTIPTITGDIVNAYIKETIGTVTNYLRNERVMKTQRKQMNAKSLLNSACLKTFSIVYIYIYIYIYSYQNGE